MATVFETEPLDYWRDARDRAAAAGRVPGDRDDRQDVAAQVGKIATAESVVMWLQLVPPRAEAAADIDRRHIGDDADVELLRRGDARRTSVSTNWVAALIRVQMRLLLLAFVQLVSAATTSGAQDELL